LKVLAEYGAIHVIGRNDTKGARAQGHPLPADVSEVYEAHFDFVWRNARRLGVPEANADDVTQDVFMIVARRIGDYDHRASMKAWIFGILSRVVREHQRSFRRKGARHVPIEHCTGPDLGRAPGPSPVEFAERSERAHQLERLLGELDHDKRTLLVLSELEDWSLREIAELYGSNINTIHSRLRAAKREFERVYRRAYPGCDAKDILP
jgi:RNA polymerase sigma-70 factor (ECF subfamily)